MTTSRWSPPAMHRPVCRSARTGRHAARGCRRSTLRARTAASPRSKRAPGRRSMVGALRIGALSCRRQSSLPDPASSAKTMPLPLATIEPAVAECRRAAAQAIDPLDVLRLELPKPMRPEPTSTAVAMPSASTANTLPSATTGPAMILERPPPPAPTSTRQASARFSAASRCCIACVALPPDWGQSGLRTGGGSVMLSSASLRVGVQARPRSGAPACARRAGEAPRSRPAKCPRRSRSGGPPTHR